LLCVHIKIIYVVLHQNDIKNNICSNEKCGNRDSGQEKAVTRISKIICL
jgi:hypothetical protein